jgi:hypothetical protein
VTPLRFANPSPPSGWIEDFHLQAVVHTRHTTKDRPKAAFCSDLSLIKAEDIVPESIGNFEFPL